MAAPCSTESDYVPLQYPPDPAPNLPSSREPSPYYDADRVSMTGPGNEPLSTLVWERDGSTRFEDDDELDEMRTKVPFMPNTHLTLSHHQEIGADYEDESDCVYEVEDTGQFEGDDVDDYDFDPRPAKRSVEPRTRTAPPPAAKKTRRRGRK